MIITTQVTKDYYPKALLLWESVKKHWDGRFILGCIGFDPEGYDGEWFRCELSDIRSYRSNWPKNRPTYVSMQAGEFEPYLDCDDSELIICIDADTIMQRPMTELEAYTIKHNATNYELQTVHSSNPPTNLYDVMVNLGGQAVGNHWWLKGQYEFTCSILIAEKWWFRYIKEQYVWEFDEMTEQTGHHAGGQWLFNKLVHRDVTVSIMPPTIQCASWYNTFDTTVEDGVLKYKGEVVLFNHTK